MMHWRESAALHAAADYPREACGLVVRIDGAEVYWPCRNMAADGDEFQAAPDDMIAPEDMGGEVVAVVHSHPDQTTPRPSPADIQACDSGGIDWHVIGWPSGKWATVTPRARIPRLAGRQFVHGVTDCYSVCRDWYRLERGVWLPDYTREDGWWDAGQNLYLDLFRDAGFVEVDGPPQPGDALLMQIRSPVPNHAAIYLAGDRILHHLGGRLSCIEAWDGALRATTKKVLRYAAD